MLLCINGHGSLPTSRTNKDFQKASNHNRRLPETQILTQETLKLHQCLQVWKAVSLLFQVPGKNTQGKCKRKDYRLCRMSIRR